MIYFPKPYGLPIFKFSPTYRSGLAKIPHTNSTILFLDTAPSVSGCPFGVSW